MNNQEIFEMLSENESKLFYASIRNKDNAELKAADSLRISAEKIKIFRRLKK